MVDIAVSAGLPPGTFFAITLALGLLFTSLMAMWGLVGCIDRACLWILNRVVGAKQGTAGNSQRDVDRTEP
jgi:hypothetical protein